MISPKRWLRCRRQYHRPAALNDVVPLNSHRPETHAIQASARIDKRAKHEIFQPGLGGSRIESRRNAASTYSARLCSSNPMYSVSRSLADIMTIMPNTEKINQRRKLRADPALPRVRARRMAEQQGKESLADQG